MEKKTTKKKTPVKAEPKPFLRGKIIDSRTPIFALKFFGVSLLTIIAFLIFASFLTIGSWVVRILLNLMILAGAYLLYFNSGANSGAEAVNLGEMLYFRRENGHEPAQKEIDRCYHPLKGLVKALIGIAPFFVIALILAVIAKRQYTGLGALPTWISGMSADSETMHALNYYMQPVSMTLEDILRMITRLEIMPWVSVFDAGNSVNMLLMERLSPILVLLPAIFYGIGYTRGVQVRAQVQSDIAANNRKRRKKQKQQLKKKQQHTAQRKGPEQLN